MKIFLRIIIYLFLLVVPVLVAGILGSMSSMNVTMGDIENRPDGYDSSLIERPPYDPGKPTVAVMAGSDSTEVLDFLIPYELFSVTNEFNVFAIAPTTNVTTLSGGLDIIPHYSFDELDGLLGRSPDVLVVPAIFYMDNEGYAAVREYIQKHSGSGTTVLSICAGAANLADAGVLDGRSATTHFGDMIYLERKYEETNWVKGKRYVVDHNIVTSAGITSGIDASLYVIAEMAGEDVAREVAATIHYPDFHYVNDPTMEHFSFTLSDAIFPLYTAYNWNKQQKGVLLFEGMEEIALGTVFDTYPVAATAITLTIAETMSPLKTQHGLYVVPRNDFDDAPNIKRLFVMGTNATTDASDEISAWETLNRDAEIVYFNAQQPERFVLEPAIEDLALQSNNPIAAFAAKRLEYRADGLQLEGNRYAIGAISTPLLIMFLSLLVAIIIDKRFIKNKQKVNIEG